MIADSISIPMDSCDYCNKKKDHYLFSDYKYSIIGEKFAEHNLNSLLFESSSVATKEEFVEITNYFRKKYRDEVVKEERLNDNILDTEATIYLAKSVAKIFVLKCDRDSMPHIYIDCGKLLHISYGEIATCDYFDVDYYLEKNKPEVEDVMCVDSCEIVTD